VVDRSNAGAVRLRCGAPTAPAAAAPSGPTHHQKPLTPRRPLHTYIRHCNPPIGNLISAGVREQIRFLVQHSMVDVLVTTAGGIEEDFIKCLGHTYVGDFQLKGGSWLGGVFW